MLERNSLAHQEVESLLSIVYDLQNLNSAKHDKKMKDRYLREQKQRAQEKFVVACTREKLVKDQIKFFISNLNLLQPRSSQNGDVDVVDIVASTPREREILNNVIPESVSRVRPTSSPSKFRLPSRPQAVHHRHRLVEKNETLRRRSKLICRTSQAALRVMEVMTQQRHPCPLYRTLLGQARRHIHRGPSLSAY